jgi:hypothetical protein
MQRNIAGEFGVEPAQESQELLMPVSLMALLCKLALPAPRAYCIH